MPDVPSRIVPGAPAPPPPTKPQKKKRKAGKKEGSEDPQTPATVTVEIPDAHAAALTDKAPRAEDVKEGAVADDLLVHGKEPSGEPKSSPVVDLLNKRTKAIAKKIVSLIEIKYLRSAQLFTAPARRRASTRILTSRHLS